MTMTTEEKVEVFRRIIDLTKPRKFEVKRSNGWQPVTRRRALELLYEGEEVRENE